MQAGMGITDDIIQGKFPAFGINFINTKKNAPRNGSFSEHFVYGLKRPGENPDVFYNHK